MKGFPEGDPRAVTAGIRGGIVSAQQRKKKREGYWIARGVDPAVAEAIRREGYQAGYAIGRKRGALRRVVS